MARVSESGKINHVGKSSNSKPQSTTTLPPTATNLRTIDSPIPQTTTKSTTKTTASRKRRNSSTTTTNKPTTDIIPFSTATASPPSQRPKPNPKTTPITSSSTSKSKPRTTTRATKSLPKTQSTPLFRQPSARLRSKGQSAVHVPSVSGGSQDPSEAVPTGKYDSGTVLPYGEWLSHIFQVKKLLVPGSIRVTKFTDVMNSGCLGRMYMKVADGKLVRSWGKVDKGKDVASAGGCDSGLLEEVVDAATSRLMRQIKGLTGEIDALKSQVDILQ